jgi:hypothetical protein
MDDERYWALVEEARERDADDVAGALVEVLKGLPGAEIAAADDAFRRISASGYTWSLWGAAYVINGGCSDDGFDYFRGWLIGKGRDVFTAALADPDSLADVVTEDDADEAFDEDMLGSAAVAHEEVVGGEMPWEVVRRGELGEGWDFDDVDEMRARYPRLTAIFS